MKRGMLWTGAAYVLAGIGLLAWSPFAEGRLGSLLFGFGFACLTPGLVMIGKYFYWSEPKRRELYREQMEAERIELRDELNVKLGDKSGRYAYVAGLLVAGVSIPVVSVLEVLELIQGGRLLVLYLGAYLLFQIVVGQVFYRRLRRKYTA